MNNFEVINIIDYGNSDQNFHKDLGGTSNYIYFGTEYCFFEELSDKEKVNLEEYVLLK